MSQSVRAQKQVVATTTRATRGSGKRTAEEPDSSDGVAAAPAPTKIRRSDEPQLDSFEAARDYLVSNQMLPPGVDIASPRDIAMVLYHVAEASATVPQFRRLIRAAAALVSEHDNRYGSQMAHEAVVEQVGYLSEEIKDMVEHARATLTTAAEDSVAKIGGAAERLRDWTAACPTQQRATVASPYRDALVGGTAGSTARGRTFLASRTMEAPTSSEEEDEVRVSRAAARLALQTRQFLFDFSETAPIRRASNMDAVGIFNDAIATIGGAGTSHLGVRKVKHLRNGGVLGEFITDEGARWFRIRENADALTKALGGGAEWRPRTYTIIAFGVPHTLDINDSAQIERVEKSNGLATGSIASMKWATPRQRRDPKRDASAVIVALNRTADANALLECNRLKIAGRVCVARKCHKEPGKCVRCLGWDHIVGDCKATDDICGFCAKPGHRHDACPNTDRPCCKPCGATGDGHSSYDRRCPTFQRKCREYDAAHPENRAPFYPADGHESDASTSAGSSAVEIAETPDKERWLRAWKRGEVAITNGPATGLAPEVQGVLIAKREANRKEKEARRQTQLTDYLVPALLPEAPAAPSESEEADIDAIAASIGMVGDASFATAHQGPDDMQEEEIPASPGLSYTSE